MERDDGRLWSWKAKVYYTITHSPERSLIVVSGGAAIVIDCVTLEPCGVDCVVCLLG